MARIASQSKGGFYATPVNEVRNVIKGLCINDDEGYVNVLDPCCGKGEALSILQHQLNQFNLPVTSFGVELEEGRANEASEVLDHVLHEGYQHLRTEPNYSALWLNPPYDESDGERIELRFLRALSSKSRNVLVRNGLLMFVVPQYILKACATILSSRFYNLKVYRFTDKEYPVFKQVVVFGYFGRPKNEERKKVAKYLREIAEAGPEALPTTEEIEPGEFVIPTTENNDHLFRAGRLNISELKSDLLESPLVEEVEKEFTPKSQRTVMKPPVLPLKPTHGGIAVASGAIGGNMGNHIISGITKQVTEVSDIIDDEGRKEGEEYFKHYKSVVRVFSPQYGVVDLE